VKSVAAGGDFSPDEFNQSLAVLKDGTVMAWGDNSNGELGIGNHNSPQVSPVSVPGLQDVTAISGGFLFSIALRADGSVASTGPLFQTVTALQTPNIPAPDRIATAVFARGTHVLVVVGSHLVKAYGRNFDAEVGGGCRAGDCPYPVTLHIPGT
jgi:alpha-tubulin suppressor-like RCC1 family protein